MLNKQDSPICKPTDLIGNHLGTKHSKIFSLVKACCKKCLISSQLSSYQQRQCCKGRERYKANTLCNHLCTALNGPDTVLIIACSSCVFLKCQDKNVPNVFGFSRLSPLRRPSLTQSRLRNGSCKLPRMWVSWLIYSLQAVSAKNVFSWHGNTLHFAGFCSGQTFCGTLHKRGESIMHKVLVPYWPVNCS